MDYRKEVVTQREVFYFADGFFPSYPPRKFAFTQSISFFHLKFMSFKLEDLPYQHQAIDAVVRLFDGQQRNYFDLQLQSDCYPNHLDLSRQEIVMNVEKIAAENGISHGEATVCIHPDYSIEMETGTGKTLVYLRTIYRLCREYGFTKFIILVPSVPIREGVLDTIESFRPQLERLYNVPLHAFEYDSKKLTKVKRFIEGTDLQVMVMTTHSFSADDNIINRSDRDDSPDGLSYWQALGKVRPILIMDEPQEGMDTENLRPRRDDFTANTVYEVKDSRRSALVCLAWNEALQDATLKRLRDLAAGDERPFFICLERSLSTTTKWNLKHFLGNHFIAF